MSILRFIPLASSSAGNAYLVDDGEARLLVECGVSYRKLRRLTGFDMANLSGCLVCHEQRAFAATMGTGQMVFGLAAVIIGTTLFRKMSFVKGTTCALIGSIIYKAVIQVAINAGLPTNLLKLITAVLFLVILVLGNLRKGREAHA